MFSFRTHLVVCLALFGALIGLAVLGNILAATGVIKSLHGPAQTIWLAVFFVLFVAAGLSAIPVMVKLVLGAQERLGNRDAPVIGAMIARQTAIVWALWILILAGLAVALPAMVADGFFGPGPKLWAGRTIGRMAAGPSLGRLAARPDMALADVARRSSLPIDIRRA
ncbi:MAG: hypothetical protein ACR2FH_11490, partial [Caulobacteraceae bacterium]